MANAVQAPIGSDATFVGLDLRVIIVREGDCDYYAQGLEIDYLAQGSTLDSVQKAFERGLKLTIEEHLKAYGTIKYLLQPAPAEVWRELLTGDGYKFHQLAVHQIPAVGPLYAAYGEDAKPVKTPRKRAGTPAPQIPVSSPATLPFGRIMYMSKAQQAATA